MGCASSKDLAGDVPPHNPAGLNGKARRPSDVYVAPQSPQPPPVASHVDAPLMPLHPDAALETPSSLLLLPTPGNSGTNALVAGTGQDDRALTVASVSDVSSKVSGGNLLSEPDAATAAKRWQRKVLAAHAHGLDGDPDQFRQDTMHERPDVDGALLRSVRRWVAEVRAASGDQLSVASPPHTPLPETDAVESVTDLGNQPCNLRLSNINLTLHARILRQRSIMAQ